MLAGVGWGRAIILRAALGFAVGKDLRVSQGWGEGTPYNCLYGEAQPVRDTFIVLNVYERVGISVVEVYKRVGKTVTSVCN